MAVAAGNARLVVLIAVVLPVAAIWDEALVYHTESLPPDAILRTTPRHRVHLIKAFLVHLLVCTTGQAYRNRARSRAPPPKTADDELMARNRALFEDKTFFFVVAWGWCVRPLSPAPVLKTRRRRWNVPELLYGARMADAERSFMLLGIVALYACLAVCKTFFRAPKPGAVDPRRLHVIFLALTCAAVDPQLGWAIKATCVPLVGTSL